jgi:hypothetical protein
MAAGVSPHMLDDIDTEGVGLKTKCVSFKRAERDGSIRQVLVKPGKQSCPGISSGGTHNLIVVSFGQDNSPGRVIITSILTVSKQQYGSESVSPASERTQLSAARKMNR